MKKFKILLLFLVLLLNVNYTLASPSRHHGHVHARYYSSPNYLIRSDYYEEEQAFADCNEHILLVKRTTNYYSNGTRNSYYTYSICDKNGNVIIPACSDIKHIKYNKNHYFLIKQNGKYYIANSQGCIINKRTYSKMKEIQNNRLLVKDKETKRFGIIDLNENQIVPIKYNKIEPLMQDLFVTKLNGYYGILDCENNIILKNEYDKIKRIYDTYLIKKYDKYGLIDINGNIVVEPNSDKIEKLGEYILVKTNKLYDVYDYTGKKINKMSYKKIRLERNSLEGKIIKNWEKIL